MVQSFSLNSGAQLAASIRLQKQYFDVTKRSGIIEGQIQYSNDFSFVSSNASSNTDASVVLHNQAITCGTTTCTMPFVLEANLPQSVCTFTGQYEVYVVGSNTDLGIQVAHFVFQIGSEDVCVIQINIDPTRC